MTGPRAAGRGPDDELFLLAIVGMLSLGAVGGIAATGWDSTVRWLLEHHLLVTPDTRPRLVLPDADGAGLDDPRLALLASGVLLLVVVASTAVRQRGLDGVR